MEPNGGKSVFTPTMSLSRFLISARVDCASATSGPRPTTRAASRANTTNRRIGLLLFSADDVLVLERVQGLVERIQRALDVAGGMRARQETGLPHRVDAVQEHRHPERVNGLRLGALQRDGVRDERVERSEEHTSELQSLTNLVCRLLLEKKKKKERSE